MKFAKELKVGLIAIVCILILVIGVNFLKGINLFASETDYQSYFPNSGMLSVSNNVTLNGVIVGKVKNIVYVPQNPIDRRVKITFTLDNENILLPKGTIIEIGSLDLFSKGILIQIPLDISKGNYKPGQTIPGRVSVDILSQVKSYADPISQKLQGMMVSVDKMITSFSSFWDTSATTQIEGSLNRLKLTIEKFGNVASEIQVFVESEKLQFSRIMTNVEGITENLRKNNDQITAILGNAEKITDDFVTTDYKTVVLNANTALEKFNLILENIDNGNGTLWKLINDDKLYNDLVETNNELQNLVSDIRINPERYINFSLIGRKNKGVVLTPKEEIKLINLLDSIPD